MVLSVVIPSSLKFRIAQMANSSDVAYVQGLVQMVVIENCVNCTVLALLAYDMGERFFLQISVLSSLTP